MFQPYMCSSLGHRNLHSQEISDLKLTVFLFTQQAACDALPIRYCHARKTDGLSVVCG